MIKAQDLDIVFNPGTALENHVIKSLSLTIEPSEFVTVIGSNGAGKSTLLNTISGEIKCQSGHIFLDDEELTHLPVHARAHLIARVFQDPLRGTCEDLSIEENMALAWTRQGRRGFSSATKRTYRANFIAQLKQLDLGLENRLSDKVGLLSGGQRQAISLLMATLRPSKLLLLDEHTAALDPKTASYIIDLTNELVSTHSLTTLMVTHSMKQALAVGSRTIMLHQGQVVLDIRDSERSAMTQEGLLEKFSQNRAAIESDTLLLS